MAVSSGVTEGRVRPEPEWREPREALTGRFLEDLDRVLELGAVSIVELGSTPAIRHSCSGVRMRVGVRDGVAGTCMHCADAYEDLVMMLLEFPVRGGFPKRRACSRQAFPRT